MQTSTASTTGTSNLPGEIVEALAIAGASSLGLQPSSLNNIELANFIQNTNQAQENEVSFQQTLDGVQATVLGKVVGMLTTLGPLQAMSAQQILTGNSVSEELSALQATVAAFADKNKPTSSGSIPVGQPGSSSTLPITVGVLRVGPPAGSVVNVIITSAAPPLLGYTGKAPSYLVTSGSVFVYDGPDEVDIRLPVSSNVGTVNITRG